MPSDPQPSPVIMPLCPLCHLPLDGIRELTAEGWAHRSCTALPVSRHTFVDLMATVEDPTLRHLLVTYVPVHTKQVIAQRYREMLIVQEQRNREGRSYEYGA